MASILAFADDLSGAAETASALRMRGKRKNSTMAVSSHTDSTNTDSTNIEPTVSLILTGDDLTGIETLADTEHDVVVIDTDTRSRTAQDAETRIREIVRLVSPDRDARIVKKIDSLLRGHLVAELAPFVEAGAGIVLCPALPVMGRSVIGGAVVADGAPLASVDAWRMQHSDAPATVAAAIAPLEASVIDLLTVRSASAGLATAIAAAIDRGHVAICDAETDDDLERIVQAAWGFDRRHAVLAGSSALAGAAAEWMRQNARGGATSEGPSASERIETSGATLVPRYSTSSGAEWGDRPVIVVAGTAEPGIRRQLNRIAEHGAQMLTVTASELLDSPHAVAESIASGIGAATCLAVTIASPASPGDGRGLSVALASAVAAGCGDADLVLTGGETARRVLEALGVASLSLGEPIMREHDNGARADSSSTDSSSTEEYGAVRLAAQDGRVIVTRPGSFGDDDSLLTIIRALRQHNFRQSKGTPMNRPIIAVTMGDGAGVGPEIVVAALLDPMVVRESCPIVIGDAGRLRQAASILKLEPEFRIIPSPSDAVFEAGVINVIDLGLLPADLQWGVLSPVAGDAAYQYVRVACELVNAGEVQAICTAPLNKEAMHLGGHLYPGHTELLAELTGTPEVSMMLSTPKIKVIHVTTHIGLIDAIAAIEPGIVERTIRRGHDALVKAGNPTPKIGVAAINPHAGENGLFGYGEEESKIAPGVRAAQAAGIDVQGPLSADTLFFLAGRGDYDLVVAMYHDQGHGPVKVLGIEAGVNITVGLPVPRTSVDHGTAFDIAGTGMVDTRSMVEAMRQAIEIAPRRVA